MEGPARTMFRVGAWRVNPTTGEISRDGETQRLEARALLLLLCLAEHADEVVSIEELLSRAWSGVIVSPDSVYQAVASLRRQLGDDPKQPAYIATVPRLGYRMVAKVCPLPKEEQITEQRNQRKDGAEASQPQHTASSTHQIWLRWLVAPAVLILAVLAIALLIRNKEVGKQPVSSALAAQPQKSVAVLPFLDLTDGMKEEEFADGMTEELINRLSKI